MILNTSHFGEIEIDEKAIILFEDGIPGFEGLHKYVVIQNPDHEVPFHWLQCIEETELAFVITNPFVFKKSYDFELSKTVIERLKIEAPTDISVYTIVVVPEDITKMTANLMAPVIINNKHSIGKQIVLENASYHTKHVILDEMKNAE